MIRPKWIPHPTAWANAVALFVFAAGVRVVMAFVMPILIALMRHSPRLAWLGMLIVWLSPIAATAALHGVAAGVIGLGESKSMPRSGWLGGPTSWWAGFFAWAAIIFVTMTTAFVVLVLHPPPVDPDSVWNLAAALTRGGSDPVRGVIWIVLAAYVCELERVAHGTRA